MSDPQPSLALLRDRFNAHALERLTITYNPDMGTVLIECETVDRKYKAEAEEPEVAAAVVVSLLGW